MSKKQTILKINRILLYIFGIVIIFILIGIVVYYYRNSIWTQFNQLVNYQTFEPLTVQDQSINRQNMDCYVINLEKNKDRMRNFQSSYNASDLATEQVIRINGIYGKEIPYENYISETPEDTLGAGMVGCFLSHLETFSQIEKGDKPYALIFEDDAKMDPKIYENTIQNVQNNVPDDWDVILLGYLNYDPTHKYVDYGNYLHALHFWGLHGYLVNQNGAKKLGELMQPPFSNQIDHVMSRLSREGKLKIYAVKTPVVEQNAKYTDVQIK